MQHDNKMDPLKSSFTIGDVEIGVGRPFIIAELSGNHNQDFELAKRMIFEAANAGVDAIKLQTYTADSMTLDVDTADFLIDDRNSLWHGEKLHQLYQKASTPYEWHQPLFEYANSLGVLAFSSPFDEDAVDFLDALNVPCFKIASFEITDLPLIARAASKKKPLIISTGMASLAEIEEAVHTARLNGCDELVLLKCTSTYPASPENSNLLTIPHLKETFSTLVGLSDHTLGIGAAVASVAFGASVIEKHFVLSREDGGVDSAFSLEPKEFEALVRETQTAAMAIGKVNYGASKAEATSLTHRRSIYVSQDIAKGDNFNANNIRVVRPAFGLPPRYKDTILGKKAKRDIAKGTPLSWALVDG